MNHFLNPLIYAKFDSDFRNAIWSLLRWRSTNRSMAPVQYSCGNHHAHYNNILDSCNGEKTEVRLVPNAAGQLVPRSKSPTPLSLY